MQVYGLAKAFELVNLRELRGMFSKQNQRSWSRFMSDAKKVRLQSIQSPFWGNSSTY
jgi:hypothetical protein